MDMIVSLIVSVGLTVTLILPVEALGDCFLDKAIIEWVQPDSLDVTALYRCGGLVCVQRWVESAGRKGPVSAACLDRKLQ